VAFLIDYVQTLLLFRGRYLVDSLYQKRLVSRWYSHIIWFLKIMVWLQVLMFLK